MTISLGTLNSSIVPTRTVKFGECIALLLTAGFLLWLGVDALPFFPRMDPNSTATLWSYMGLIAGLLLLPIALTVFTKSKAANLLAIGLATLAFSVFAAQALLLLVDRISDQTYLLLNPYLNEVNPVFPLVISFLALTISIMRLRTDQLS